MKRLFSLAAVACIGFAPQTATADIIAFEDFDGGAINLVTTSNVFDFGGAGGSGGDVFGRVSPFNGGAGTGGPFDVWDDSVADMSGGGVFPGDTRGLVGRAGSAFFAMNDMDGPGIPVILNDATWTFNISGGYVIDDIQMDIGAIGDFEAASSDGFTISAQIDGGGYQTIFQGITDEDASKTYRAMDDGTIPTDTNDPLELFIDGAATGIFLDKADALTGLFDTYVSTLFAGQTGSTLDIRISWAGTPSGSEPMGFDNFVINGSAIPEPTTAGLLGLIGLGMAAGYRRRR